MKLTPKKGWAILLIAAVIFPLMVSSPYIIHIIILSLIYAILATSLNLISGYTGLLSLGHQAFFGIGAYTSALLVLKLSVPYPLALLAAGLLSMFSAYVIGKITFRLRSAFFAISTIATGEMLRLISLNWDSVTQGPMGIANIPSPSFGPLVFDTPVKAYYLILILTILSIIASYRVVHSHVGRVLRGIRDAEYVAKASGVNPNKYLMISILVGGFMAGIAGSFFAHFMKFLSPDVFYFTVCVNIIVMMIAGGLGTIAGPVLGAFIFTAVPEFLRFSDQYNYILYGATLVIIVLFIPGGLWSLLEKLRLKLRSYYLANGGKSLRKRRIFPKGG